MMELEYWDYICPSCGKKSLSKIEVLGVLKCSCGMAFRPMISGETLKVDSEEKRNEIRRILEKNDRRI